MDRGTRILDFDTRTSDLELPDFRAQPPSVRFYKGRIAKRKHHLSIAAFVRQVLYD